MDSKQEIVAGVRRNWKLVIGLGVLGLFVAVLLVIGGAAGLAWTNTEAFCIGCHEMRDNVYAEYKGTIHDTNRTGVRAICTDCHVPREPGPLILAKIHATWDLYGHIMGLVDTKEKFQAKRAELAHRVWARMLKNDSHECRNCHKSDHMEKDKQSEKAQARHAKAKAEGLTCIECHFGIAHQEPEGPGPQEMKASLTK